MAEDRFDDKRRAKVRGCCCADMHDVTFDQWKQAAFDTTLYWPLVNLPRLALELKALENTDSALAAKAQPYLDHLLHWDCRSTIDSTQTTLCVAWYEELYGRGYPVETLKTGIRGQPVAQVSGAGYGRRETKGILWRLARPLGRHQPACSGTPTLPTRRRFLFPMRSRACRARACRARWAWRSIPITRRPPPQHKKQYGVVGGSFIGVYEFGDKVQASTILQFGQSSHPDSPHFMDQAQLYSKQQFKPAWYEWSDVLAHCKSTLPSWGRRQLAWGARGTANRGSALGGGTR